MERGIDDILSGFVSISLEEMNAIRLINRTDMKYVTTRAGLEKILALVEQEYRVQEIGGAHNLPYYTLYYDTPRQDMFMAHQNGRSTRQKVRIRSYVGSGLSFLEVKSKNNHGRTDKRRVRVATTGLGEEGSREFLSRHLFCAPECLDAQLENRFDRITLVNRCMTERLTIDTNLRFHNLRTGNDCSLKDLVIIELKRDGNTASPVREILRRLRVHPGGFSKYCMGLLLTDASLKRNCFKPRLHALEHLLA